MPVLMYELIDPRSGLPRYIGKTKVSLTDRLAKHVYDARRSQDHKANWIKALLMEGFRPCIRIIDTVPESEWQFWERHYISLYRSWGFDLLNMTEGGDELQLTPEILEKRRIWRNSVKIVRSAETRRKISEAQIGKKLTEQHIRNLTDGVRRAYAMGRGHRSTKKIVQRDINGNVVNTFRNVHELMQTSQFSSYRQVSIYNACRLGTNCGGFKLEYA